MAKNTVPTINATDDRPLEVLRREDDLDQTLGASTTLALSRPSRPPKSKGLSMNVGAIQQRYLRSDTET